MIDLHEPVPVTPRGGAEKTCDGDCQRCRCASLAETLDREIREIADRPVIRPRPA